MLKKCVSEKNNAEKKIAASRRELLKKYLNLWAKNPSKKCEQFAENPQKLLKRVFSAIFRMICWKKSRFAAKIAEKMFVIFVSKKCWNKIAEKQIQRKIAETNCGKNLQKCWKLLKNPCFRIFLAKKTLLVNNMNQHHQSTGEKTTGCFVPNIM